jgi:hypothetical protein
MVHPPVFCVYSLFWAGIVFRYLMKQELRFRQRSTVFNTLLHCVSLTRRVAAVTQKSKNKESVMKSLSLQRLSLSCALVAASWPLRYAQSRNSDASTVSVASR